MKVTKLTAVHAVNTTIPIIKEEMIRLQNSSANITFCLTRVIPAMGRAPVESATVTVGIAIVIKNVIQR